MTSISDTSGTGAEAGGTDAVSRYRYLLSTSAPEDIERAHREAFEAMTPAERQEVLTALARGGETPADASSTALARSAARLEMKRPGTLNSLFGSGAGRGGTVLASLAAGFVGSAVWSGLTGGDGVGGRPGLLSRLFGLGGRRGGGYGMDAGGGLFGGSRGGGPMGGGPGPMCGGGFGGGPGGGGPGGGPSQGGPGGGGFGGGGAGGRF